MVLTKKYDERTNEFRMDTMVTFSQCNKKKTFSLNGILGLTSDTAADEYAERGISTDALKKNGLAILVSRLAFRFHKMPRENQYITLTTWEEKPETFQLKRQYEITDSKTSEKLVSGYSTWLIIDALKRRIIPTKKFTMRPEVEIEKGHDSMEPGKIIMPESLEFLDERKIKYSDIDGNGHTTNSRYAAFVMDSLPEKYSDKEFSDFRINFSKEALLGETVKIYAGFQDDEKKVTVVGKTENGNCFESELFWK